jgi:DNA end-binding protein Ku
VVIRDRQHLVAVEALADHLILTMMRFAEQMVEAPAAPALESVKVPARELKLAHNLIEALASDWEPEKYSDDYQRNLEKVIKGKLKGETVVLEDAGHPLQAEVVDLAERLKASLAAAESRSGRSSTKKGPSSRGSAPARRRGAKSRRKEAA